MSQSNPIRLISREEIRGVYMRGEDAVIELVTGLVEQIAQQETRLKEWAGFELKLS